MSPYITTLTEAAPAAGGVVKVVLLLHPAAALFKRTSTKKQTVPEATCYYGDKLHENTNRYAISRRLTSLFQPEITADLQAG